MITILSLTKSKSFGVTTNGVTRYAVKISACTGSIDVKTSGSILSSVAYGADRFSVVADLSELCGGVFVKNEANENDYEATLNKVAESWYGAHVENGYAIKLKISEIVPEIEGAVSLKIGEQNASEQRRIISFGETYEQALESAKLAEHQRIIGRCKKGTYALLDVKGEKLAV